MNHRWTTLALALAAALLARAPGIRAQDAADDTLAIYADPGDLEWKTSPSGASFAALHGAMNRPGPFAFRMRMPAHWTMRPHTHDTGEYITVISGTLYMTFEEDGEWVTLPPGSVVAVPAGHPMWAKTEDDPVEIQIHGVGPFHTRLVE